MPNKKKLAPKASKKAKKVTKKIYSKNSRNAVYLPKLHSAKKSQRSKIIAKKQSLQSSNQPEEIELKRTKIRVFGIGGGGSSIISEIASRVKKATFVAVNTDTKALAEANKHVSKFQFGDSFTHGLGTGMNALVGEAAALAEKERIGKLFEGQDLCVFVSCLGGGTASGATKIFAKLAKSAGCLTYGIFTLPFNFEGEKKAAIARESLNDLKQKLHAFSVIPNERIFQIIEKETPLKQALSTINSRLANSLEGLIEIIYEPGLINIDFADFKAILEGQGKLSYLNTVEVPKKEGAVQDEVDKLLNSQLYPYGIRGAKNVLYNIAGENGLTLAEVSQISRNISELVNKEARIIFGISQNPKYKGVIKTTLLATGCGTKIFSEMSKIESKSERKSDLEKKSDDKKNEEVPKMKKARKIASKPKKSQLKNIHKVKSVKPAMKKRGSKQKKPISKPKRSVKRVRVKVAAKNDESKIDEATIPMFPAASGATEPGAAGIQTAKIRKNALQVREEVVREEEQMLARERAWETPAFLRKKKIS